MNKKNPGLRLGGVRLTCADSNITAYASETPVSSFRDCPCHLCNSYLHDNGPDFLMNYFNIYSPAQAVATTMRGALQSSRGIKSSFQIKAPGTELRREPLVLGCCLELWHIECAVCCLALLLVTYYYAVKTILPPCMLY